MTIIISKILFLCKENGFNADLKLHVCDINNLKVIFHPFQFLGFSAKRRQLSFKDIPTVGKFTTTLWSHEGPLRLTSIFTLLYMFSLTYETNAWLAGRGGGCRNQTIQAQSFSVRLGGGLNNARDVAQGEGTKERHM